MSRNHIMEIDDNRAVDAIAPAPPTSWRCGFGGGAVAFDSSSAALHLAAPSLASLIVIPAVVALTATFAPADSIVRACVVSCGTASGYAYTILLLALVLHLLRAACTVCAMMLAWLMPRRCAPEGVTWLGISIAGRGIYGPVPSRSPEDNDDGSGGDGSEGEGKGKGPEVKHDDAAVPSCVPVIEEAVAHDYVDKSTTSRHHGESSGTPSNVIRAGHNPLIARSSGKGDGDVGGVSSSDDDLGKDHHTTARKSTSLLRFDFAVVTVLYLSLCSMARFAWAPPTFDLDTTGDDVEGGDTLATFPPEFLFGAATSSYQVEGNLFNNQWAEFEKVDGHIVGNQHCGAAADVWDHYFDEDLRQRIVSELNLTAFRFSIEWSRVEPEQGVFDDEALDKYASWASALIDAGVEPIVTLHHFTNPLWFERMGGFENETSHNLILPYVRRVVARLGAVGVKRWITINEIMVYAGNGYLMGDFPPGRSGEMGTMLGVVRNMLRAHASMYRTIHKVGGEGAAVSVAKSAILYQPWSYLDAFAVMVAAASDLYYNAAPVRIMQRQGTLDLLGLNSYIRLQVGFMGTSMGFTYPPERQSDMGWDLDPHVLHRAVRRYHDLAPEMDIVITEHGAADGDDPDVRRVRFLRESLVGLARAVNVDGLPVVGYMHWSLLDNWEWSEGYGPKFGLYRIDLPTHQERRLTDGGKLYREVISTRRVPGSGWRPK